MCYLYYTTIFAYNLNFNFFVSYMQQQFLVIHILKIYYKYKI